MAPRWKILNPKTGRYVKIKGKIGQEILGKKSSKRTTKSKKTSTRKIDKVDELIEQLKIFNIIKPYHSDSISKLTEKLKRWEKRNEKYLLNINNPKYRENIDKAYGKGIDIVITILKLNIFADLSIITYSFESFYKTYGYGFTHISPSPSTSIIYNNYYRILGVEKQGLTKNKLKKAYHKMILKYHPDKNPLPHAKTKFQKIQEAYEKLRSLHK